MENLKNLKDLKPDGLVGAVKKGVESYKENGSLFDAAKDAISQSNENVENNLNVAKNMVTNNVNNAVETMKSIFD